MQNLKLPQLIHDLRTVMVNFYSLSNRLVSVHESESSLLNISEIKESAAFLTQRGNALLEELTRATLEEELKTTTETITNINEWVLKTGNLYKLTAANKRIWVEVKVPANPVYLPIKTQHLLKVLDNLLSNAVKFTPPYGNISLRLKETARHVSILVSDSGIGIKPVEKVQLNNLNSLPPKKGTGNEPSTGFGLSIVKDILSDYGARIEVISPAKRGGTTFKIIFTNKQS